jgi:hypothetical protein
MKRTALILLVVLVACGGNGATTTTGDTSTTATSGSTTTSATTSTTAATTTTTAAPDPGVPVVASRFGVMGWWDGGSWVPGDGSVEIPLVGGEQFQVVLLDEPIGTVTGSSLGICEPIGTPLLHFEPPLPEDFQVPGGIAILADWDVRPHPVTLLAAVPDEHVDAVAQFLSNRGIDDADPNIEQVVVTDIEGDGVAEVLIVVNRLPPDLFGGPGDYSAVLLRKQIEGEWQTAVLEFDEPEDESPYILMHVVAALADLNNDARMEIVIDAFYYEGAGTVAYEYVNDDLGPQEAIGGGCGA